jgi:polyphenol oxidase
MQTIIKSEILTQYPEIIHGISTKYPATPVVGVVTNNTSFSNNMSKFVSDDLEQVMKNRSEFYTRLGIDMSTAKFAHANQIHSGNVTAVTDGGLFKETDALITNKKGVFLVISVADCLPVMIYDTVKHIIANVHSGWRGTAKGIVTNTLHKMKDEFGCNTGDMTAFIGPGISKENFEVGAEVAEMFEVKYVNPHSDKFYIDLKSVVTDQLTAAGVNPANIDTCPYCTFSEKNMLHSYRRDKESSGRMFAVIGMRDN